MAQILIILSSSAAFLMIYFFVLTIFSKEEKLEDKIKRFTAYKNCNTKDEKKNIRHLITLLARLTPKKWRQKLDKDLQRSGIPLNGGEFLILQTFLFIVFLLATLTFAPKNKTALILPIFGLILPRLYILKAKSKKLRQFNNQLADTLLILANSLRAGFSLLQAMEMASQEMPDPISTEFKITLKEMTYGESTETALNYLADRVGSRDLDLVVTAILIQRQIGGNLAEVLLNIHETIQERLRIEAEVKSLTAQGRLSGYIIAFLPFGLGAILSILQPDYFSVLLKTPIGISLIVSGIISQIVGFIFIKKIVNIKV